MGEKNVDPMSQIVAHNVRALREREGLSLERLSKLSGVSKSMFAQIERGEGNPTLSTLWNAGDEMVSLHMILYNP